jgi:hypothetical protein
MAKIDKKLHRVELARHFDGDLKKFKMEDAR